MGVESNFRADAEGNHDWADGPSLCRCYLSSKAMASRMVVFSLRERTRANLGAQQRDLNTRACQLGVVSYYAWLASQFFHFSCCAVCSCVRSSRMSLAVRGARLSAHM